MKVTRMEKKKSSPDLCWKLNPSELKRRRDGWWLLTSPSLLKAKRKMKRADASEEGCCWRGVWPGRDCPWRILRQVPLLRFLEFKYSDQLGNLQVIEKLFNEFRHEIKIVNYLIFKGFHVLVTNLHLNA